MPLYASRDSNSAVIPVVDKNHPTPDPGVPSSDSPAFLEDLYLRLAAVRSQLSKIWAKYCKPSIGDRDPYDPDSGTAIEQQVDYYREKQKLEIEEAALVAQINYFTYTASLSVNDHDVDDVPSDAHQAYAPAGGDVAAPAAKGGY